MSINKDQLLVSVIIPVYNCEKYIAEAIDSVLSQTYQPIEIIVVDDGSTDKTAEIIKNYGSALKYFYQENSGKSVARNYAISKANGDFFAFLDADDIWLQNKLEIQMEVFNNNYEIEAVFGLVQQFYSPELDEFIRSKIYCNPNPIVGYTPSATLIKRNAFFRIGEFDPMLRCAEFVNWFALAKDLALKLESPNTLVAKKRLHDMNTGIKFKNDVRNNFLKIFKASLNRRRHEEKQNINLIKYCFMEKKTSDEEKFLLARAWHLKGKIDTAIQGYQETIKLQQDHLQAYFYLGKIYFQQKQLDLAFQVLNKAININSNEAEIHKCLINTLIEKDGIDSPFEFYQLQRQDQKEINLLSNDILVCVVVRNEAPRLPYFLSYYREKGIAKFLIIDNESTDNTREFLLQQDDVYLWQSNLSFNRANFGSAWFEVLLRKYGLNHWCLIVDADELFFYPDAETTTITQLCQILDSQGKKAFNAILLDMYSDIPIKDTLYTAGKNFVEVCPYFDRQSYHDKYDLGSPYKNQTAYIGGVRERVFGSRGHYYLSKVPLIKYTEDIVLTGGQHSTNCKLEEIASETGCLLHFKFFSSFYDYVQSEVIRKEHSGGGIQYKEYEKVINENEALTLYDSQHSVRFQNSQQLVELGIMNRDRKLKS